MDKFEADALLWTTEPFKHATPETQILKLQAELVEFLENPTLEEAADILVCLSGWAWHKGYSMEVLLDYWAAKNTINLNRTWTRQENGTWQHD